MLWVEERENPSPMRSCVRSQKHDYGIFSQAHFYPHTQNIYTHTQIQTHKHKKRTTHSLRENPCTQIQDDTHIPLCEV